MGKHREVPSSIVNKYRKKGMVTVTKPVEEDVSIFP